MAEHKPIPAEELMRRLAKQPPKTRKQLKEELRAEREKAKQKKDQQS
jgi:hypothetical protein